MVTRKLCALGLGLYFLLACSCVEQAERQIGGTGTLGDYLGQSPPGNAPELFAPGIVSSGSHELDIMISYDLNEIYFTRSGPDWFSAIICIRRIDDRWSEPEVVQFPDFLPSNYPCLSPDGRQLFFDMLGNLPGDEEERNDRNLWVADRAGNGWDDPRPLSPPINTIKNETFVSVAENGTIYFCVNPDESVGGFDIYRAVPSEEGFGAPQNLGIQINTAYNEFHPFIAPDEQYLIFDAQRPNGHGSNDLYISFRDRDGWTTAVNMGPEINTQAGEMRPFVSPDGRYFFFCSNRNNSRFDEQKRPVTCEDILDRIDGPGNGFQDIYWVDAGIIARLREDAFVK